FQASPFSSRLAGTSGRIEFVSYGLAVRLPLLSTSFRNDAVTVGYRPESAYLERTRTPLAKCACRRTRSGFQPLSSHLRSLRSSVFSSTKPARQFLARELPHQPNLQRWIESGWKPLLLYVNVPHRAGEAAAGVAHDLDLHPL